MIERQIKQKIQEALDRGKSVLLLGARQTGKTTLFSQFTVDLRLSLVQYNVRQRYERSPELLGYELEALYEDKARQVTVWIDEIQKVPALLDAIQDLIDRKIVKFLLTGSSARKLRAQMNTNWLPGRLVVLYLDGLMQSELVKANRIVPLNELLCYGTLPGIINTLNPEHKEIDLETYVNTYLEEEVRSEALVRKIGSFSKFLTLAASESGQIVNFTKLSQEIGVAHTTIASYYQILEDCLIAEPIEPITKTKVRRRLIKTPKYLFFDLGVRRLSAREPNHFPQSYWGHLLEQWVGLEIIRHVRSFQIPAKLYFWRDANGPEVDWVLEWKGSYVPIEVKWTERPTYRDSKHLELFKKEYPNTQKAWLICRTPHKLKLAEGVYACSWSSLIPAIFS